MSLYKIQNTGRRITDKPTMDEQEEDMYFEGESSYDSVYVCSVDGLSFYVEADSSWNARSKAIDYYETETGYPADDIHVSKYKGTTHVIVAC